MRKFIIATMIALSSISSQGATKGYDISYSCHLAEAMSSKIIRKQGKIKMLVGSIKSQELTIPMETYGSREEFHLRLNLNVTTKGDQGHLVQMTNVLSAPKQEVSTELHRNVRLDRLSLSKTDYRVVIDAVNTLKVGNVSVRGGCMIQAKLI